MRLIFCGGGTAGHVTPALAIAERILEKNPNTEILFVGRDGGDENQIIKKRGFDIKTLKIYGFQRKLSIKTIKNIHVALTALKKAKEIIKEFSHLLNFSITSFTTSFSSIFIPVTPVVTYNLSSTREYVG